ncbi:MAG TPA: lysylphosphatidylglycerol synthase transmembrane domain-containing protein [Anaerolineae bacterium]|nr:lysylphosphatidylglycerol synthase transmembrane domain-containing protein [Anaerolineae bacterium]
MMLLKGMTWRRALGWGLALVILIFLIRTLWSSWDQVAQSGFTFQFNLPLLILSLVLLVPGRSFGVEAWRRILRALGDSISFRFAIYAWFVSNLARFIPGNVWQVAAMMMLTENAGVSKLNVVLSQAVYAVIALSVAALYGLTLLPLPASDAPLIALAFGALIVLFALPAVFQWMVKVSTRLLRIVRRNQTIPEPRVIHTTFWQGLIPPLCSFLFWSINGLAFWLFVRSITDISIETIPAFIGMNAAAYFIGYVSFITPSGLGFREASLALFLGAFFPAPVAVAIAFLTRVWSIAGEMLGVSLAVWWRPKESPVAGRQSPVPSHPSSVVRPPSK